MNSRNIMIFILKYLITPVILIVFLYLYNYMLGNVVVFPNIENLDKFIILYIIFVSFTAIFWSFISYLELRVGELMEANWKQRIVFIIIALVLIYLYRATGRI